MTKRRGVIGEFFHELTKPYRPAEIVKARRKNKTMAKKTRARVNAQAQKTIENDAAKETKAAALAAQRAAAKKTASPRKSPAPARRPTRDDLAVRRSTPRQPVFKGAGAGAVLPTASPQSGPRDDDPAMFTRDATGFDFHTATAEEQQARLRAAGLCGSRNTSTGHPCLNRSHGVCAAGHRMPKGGGK